MNSTTTQALESIAAIYSKALRENFQGQAMKFLPNDDQKMGIITTMLQWLDTSISEVTPGGLPMSFACTNTGAGSTTRGAIGGAPGGFPPPMQGQSQGANNFGIHAVGGQSLQQHAYGAPAAAAAGGAEILPPDCVRTIDRTLIGTVYRVSTHFPEPAGGCKCGIRTTKKGKEYPGKYYCTKKAGSVNAILQIRTCSSHKTKSTTGDDEPKSSGTKANSVTSAAQYFGANNGTPVPQGFNPNNAQMQQIGTAMQQSPNFQNPIHPAPGFGAPQGNLLQNQGLPAQASSLDMSNALMANVQPQLQNMQVTHQANAVPGQQFPSPGAQPNSQAINPGVPAPSVNLGAFGSMGPAPTPNAVPTPQQAQVQGAFPPQQPQVQQVQGAFPPQPQQPQVVVSQPPAFPPQVGAAQAFGNPVISAFPQQSVPQVISTGQPQTIVNGPSDDEEEFQHETESDPEEEESDHDDALAVQKAMSMAQKPAVSIANPGVPAQQEAVPVTANPALSNAFAGAQASPFQAQPAAQTQASPFQAQANPGALAMMNAAMAPK
jgi:hypothetical protein